MSEEKGSAEKPRPRLGVTDKITVNFQFEYERRRSELRTIDDPLQYQNNLADIISDLASEISAKGGEAEREVIPLLEELKSDDLNPKLNVEVLRAGVQRYKVIQIKKVAEFLPPDIEVGMKFIQGNVDRDIIRKLWVLHAKMRALARRYGILQRDFSVSDAEVSEKRKRIEEKSER